MITVSEMNETSTTTTSTSPPTVVRRGVADVGPLDDGHPLVAAQPRVQLPVADVEGDHPRGPAREQAVGEPAGRRPDVEHARPATSMPKCVERGIELLAATADEARRRSGDDDGVAGRHQSCRLVGDRAVDEDPSRVDGRVRVGSAGDEAAPHELGVEPPAGRHSAR